MSEDRYRLCKATLATVAVMGLLFIGFRYAENSRYQQVEGRGSFYDTRTGKIRKNR